MVIKVIMAVVAKIQMWVDLACLNELVILDSAIIVELVRSFFVRDGVIYRASYLLPLTQLA